jgi:hypothetical protein
MIPLPTKGFSDNCQGQVNELVFAEPAASLLVNIIRHVSLADQRNCFCPGECGAFTLGEESCLLPDPPA